MHRLRRAICYLIGCDFGPMGCERCAVHPYDSPGCFDGPCRAIRATRRAFDRIRTAIAGRRCAVCGKRYRTPFRDWWEPCCSDECYTKWIPF